MATGAAAPPAPRQPAAAAAAAAFALGLGRTFHCRPATPVPQKDPLVLVHAYNCDSEECNSATCRYVKTRWVGKLKNHAAECRHRREGTPSQCKVCKLCTALAGAASNRNRPREAARLAFFDRQGKDSEARIADEKEHGAWLEKCRRLSPEELKQGLLAHVNVCRQPGSCSVCSRIRTHQDDPNGDRARERIRSHTRDALSNPTRPVTASVFKGVCAPSEIQQRGLPRPRPQRRAE